MGALCASWELFIRPWAVGDSAPSSRAREVGTSVTNEIAEIGLGETARNWLRNFDESVPVVVVPVFNAYDDVMECVASLLASTSPGIPVLIVDDASTDDRVCQTLSVLASSRGLGYVRKPANGGFVRTVNSAFEWCRPRDVVILNSDVVVPEGWIERLQAAACSLSTIATATPFTNNGTIVSVPYRNQPIGYQIGGMTVNELDARVRAASLLLRPLIPAAVGHCVYFKRLALEAVGYFDEAFSPGYGEEVDFSLRAVNAGFCHVVADDVFVYHKGWRSFGSQGEDAKLHLQANHERIINTRYPWYPRWVQRAQYDAQSPLALAIEAARAALLGYRVAIDATKVGGPATGTTILTLELIRALASAPNRFAHLSMIVADGVRNKAFHGVDEIVDEVIRVSELEHLEAPFDLAYRPYQVSSPGDLHLLFRISNRFVVSQLDCIALSSPIYAENYKEWELYRRLAQLVFASADGVTFISQAAVQEAVQQGLYIPEERVCVTYAGVDHELDVVEPTPPAKGRELSEASFILMLGTNFKHKNRVYALKLLRVLISKYHWPGKLVLAGPNVAYGGSQAEEALLLLNCPELSSRVEYLGAVDEAQKRWLLEQAALVLYPSVREGFGLIPFEAAAAGTPALTSRMASLPEVLGSEVAYLEGFDPEIGADLVWSLLCDPVRAGHQVAMIESQADAFAWQRVADKTWRFFGQVLALPPRSRQLSQLPEEIARLAGSQERARYVSPAPATSWSGRVKRAFRIWQIGGIKALVRETRQFIGWLSARP